MIKKLLAIGATYLQQPRISQDRPKVIGCMWDGTCSLELGKLKFVFRLWHHGDTIETVESLLPEFRLKGLKIDDKCYDISWCTLITNEAIWLHNKGWFRNIELSKHELVKRQGNINFNRPVYTKDEQKQLRALGFKRIVKF
jgi:hypothetical protein